MPSVLVQTGRRLSALLGRQDNSVNQVDSKLEELIKKGKKN